jgi:glycyl-tRNA synthetase
MQKKGEELFKVLVSHCKEYGFIFQSSEIYDGLAAVYDYGHYGAELKNNIRNYWWQSMVHHNDNIVGLDSAIFMHPTIWKASGHVDAFNDPLIDNKDSKKRYRADVLIEDHIQKLEQKIEKEVEKAAKRFGDNFNREMFLETNERVLELKERISSINRRMNESLNAGNLEDVRELIQELEIVCPVSGTKNWTDVRQFNLMFATRFGAASEDIVYLRPETAQGIFVNFSNVLKTSRMKIPFGIAQTGKAFRNEIVARQFIFRMREFEQMEMQFFVKPGEELQWYELWKEKRMKWHLSMGFPQSSLRWHDHEKLAHYANAACDIEFAFPFGFKELEGIHSRTDFDLAAHEKYSGKKLRYFDPDMNESYIPYVVETSIGLDRTFLATMSNAYTEETLEDGTERVVLRFAPFLSPVKVAVLPLVKKDGMPEAAHKIFDELKFNFVTQFDEKDTIGRRYRRQDAIGTPFCITIDNETLADSTVTVRHRDSMKQIRIEAQNLKTYLTQNINQF